MSFLRRAARRDASRPPRPARSPRPDVLDKFCVAGQQAASVAAALRPLTRAYAAHPTSVAAANAATLPILLSSTPLPEAAAAATAAADAAAAGAGVGGGASAVNPGDAYVALGAAADAVNALVDRLTLPTPDGAPDPHRGVLAPASAARRALAAAAHAAAAPGAGAPPPGSGARAVDARGALIAAALAGGLPREEEKEGTG
jgi:hypothetical protein